MTSTMTDTTQQNQPGADTDVLDVLIIGGGFSGLYALDRLRDEGFQVKVWDAAGDFGGIWWWNCYPGARTDSTGQIYQFQYKDLWKEYEYSELYPGYDGVRDYLKFVDAKLDLAKDVEPHWVWWRLWSFDFNQGLSALLGSVEPPFELGGREVVEVAV